MSPNTLLSGLLDNNSEEQTLQVKIVGALGMQDNVRPKARSALAHAMGPAEDRRINVRMLTGDAKATAQAVAMQVGLIT